MRESANSPALRLEMALGAFLTDRGFSPTLIETFRAVTRGLSNGRIAAERCVSVNTVKTEARELFRRLGVTSRGELVLAVRATYLLCELGAEPGVAARFLAELLQSRPNQSATPNHPQGD